ncbi:MAG: AtzE family amidohydrolase, partial [Acidithiobacillus sp.]
MKPENDAFPQAQAIAQRVRSGEWRAAEVVQDTLRHIHARNGEINAFTCITEARALREAEAVDQKVARGEDPGPLAGVPFAVKNLFDLQGEITLAGSKINQKEAPAVADATAVRRLTAAGAVMVGALNMGEYAYDFTGENIHYGPSRNPHDRLRMTGGSSGGSGAAVAAGMVPIALGSDTNGSIRVPSSLCGIFGLKPTYGRLSRAGAFPFCPSLDHVGPLARSVADLALAYDAMQGVDAADPVCADRASEPVSGSLADGVAGLKIAIAAGYFMQQATPAAEQALARVAAALNVTDLVEFPGTAQARAAAYLITNAESSNLHL